MFTGIGWNISRTIGNNIVQLLYLQYTIIIQCNVYDPIQIKYNVSWTIILHSDQIIAEYFMQNLYSPDFKIFTILSSFKQLFIFKADSIIHKVVAFGAALYGEWGKRPVYHPKLATDNSYCYFPSASPEIRAFLWFNKGQFSPQTSTIIIS